MAKTGKKRQLSETEATDDQQIVKENEEVSNKDVSKKKKKNKKSKPNADDVAVVKSEEVQVSNNTDGAEKSPKKSKKKNKKNKAKKESTDGSVPEVVSPAKESSEKAKSTTEAGEQGEKVYLSKKDKFKQKREEWKQQRQAKRREEGQFASLNKLSIPDLKRKIAEIEGRGVPPSKSVKRKLRILKKKLSVEEGTADSLPDIPRSKRKSGAVEENASQPKNKKMKKEVPIKTESPVSKENSQLNNTKKSKKEKKAANQVIEKPLFIEDRVGDKKLTKKGKKNKNKDSDEEESEILKAKKILDTVLSEQKQKSMKIETQNGDEEDSEDEEDDDVANTSKATNGSEEDIDDDDDDEDDEEEDAKDDDDDDDDDEEEGEEAGDENESAKPLPKQQVKKEKPKDLTKQKPNQPSQQEAAKKHRYVLFVGNLAYDATTVDIKKHFLTKCDKIRDVRIPLKPGSNTPRGFAYVEVEDRSDYEKGLSLHDTFINGRKINVEYTASGSKKVSNKVDVVKKNERLHAMRRRGTLAGSQKPFQKRSFRRNPDHRNPRNES